MATELPRTARLFIGSGAVFMLFAVACGAFGAHALKASLSADMLAVWRTAVEYHAYHSLGLIAVGLLAMRLSDSRLLRWSGWTMAAGVVLFSGSLYGLALSGARPLGMVTPVGGVLLLVSWGLLAVAALRDA